MTTPSQPLVEVVLRVAPEVEEQAVAHLLELSPAGFRHDTLEDGRSEFGVYVVADQEQSVGAFLARAGVEFEQLPPVPVPADYAERWKEFHTAVKIGQLWVGPPWQLDDAPAGLRKVVVDPGQGFGTGAHPTTRLMLALLLDQQPCSVLDVGCGSGVLAIAARLLGFGPVTAVDNDPVAIDSTRHNIGLNRLESGVQVQLMDALVRPLPRADLVLANIQLEPLQKLARRVQAPRIIVSGLLRSHVERAEDAFREYGYVSRERRDRDGWVALVLDNVDIEGVAARHRPVF